MAQNKLWLVIISVLILISCDNNKIKEQFYTSLPPILKKIKNNNNKIPSFVCRFSMSSKSPEKNITADGTAYIDKENHRIKILLIDTLAEETILDLVKINNSIQLYIFNTSGGVIIKGNYSRLKISDYFPDLKLELSDLIELLRGEIFILPNPSKIKEQQNTDSFIYLLSKDKKNQIISINKNNNTQQHIYYDKGVELYRIFYKKYFNQPNFFFPKRSDFHHHPTKSKTIVYISNIKFSPQFQDHIFQFKQYSKARIINDPN